MIFCFLIFLNLFCFVFKTHRFRFNFFLSNIGNKSLLNTSNIEISQVSFYYFYVQLYSFSLQLLMKQKKNAIKEIKTNVLKTSKWNKNKKKKVLLFHLLSVSLKRDIVSYFLFFFCFFIYDCKGKRILKFRVFNTANYSRFFVIFYYQAGNKFLLLNIVFLKKQGKHMNCK